MAADRRRVRPRPPEAPRLLADGWYGNEIETLCPFREWLAHRSRPLAGLADRFGAVRGALLFVASIGYDAVAVIRTDPGWRSLLLLRAIAGRRRKLVAFHFIDFAPRDRGLGRVVDRLWRPVDRWATRRALAAAQVLAEWEPGLYATRFGIEEQRFRFVPFAWRTPREGQLPPARTEGTVISAGRAYCDWPTLFAAAADATWPLVVVCARQDLPLVSRLNEGSRAQVLCELPIDEMRAAHERATVCVIAMHEAGVSQGQVRLRDAVDAGLAVVASETRSLSSYARHEETALLVAPGDVPALRGAIDRLVGDASQRERLRGAAFDRARAWTWPDYLQALESLAHGRCTPLPLSEPAK